MLGPPLGLKYRDLGTTISTKLSDEGLEIRYAIRRHHSIATKRHMPGRVINSISPEFDVRRARSRVRQSAASAHFLAHFAKLRVAEHPGGRGKDLVFFKSNVSRVEILQSS